MSPIATELASRQSVERGHQDVSKRSKDGAFEVGILPPNRVRIRGKLVRAVPKVLLAVIAGCARQGT